MFCEEQMCEDQVFPLAVNFLDRFLCLSTIRREQLQLLACACLLLASKIRQCHVLSVNTLCAYAEHGFSAELLRKWERLLLLKLEWCATAVTGFDFVDHVLQRTPWGENNPVIQRHAHTLVALCYTEPDFIQTLPSLLTAGSIIAAVRGLRIANQKEAFRDVCTLTRSDPSDADAMASRIEVILATATVQQQDSPQLQSANKAATSPGSASSGNKHVADMDDDMNHTPETPTDIHDIHF